MCPELGKNSDRLEFLVQQNKCNIRYIVEYLVMVKEIQMSVMVGNIPATDNVNFK